MRKILIIFLIIFLISCTKNSNEILINNGQKIIKINVEIADDENERNNGLMFRKELDKDSGMLFTFNDEDYRTFWMKDTLIPLDIIFINKDWKIIDIKNAVPCKEDPCRLYHSSLPAKYVLEVNAGFAQRNDIEPGDKIVLNQ
ncbi:DUF192 domain-containing protein [Candidatus Woesearchaeota archaeon]|nr:DUF192 domain-containing protein [Candidatus Woesearchaeota archaeon]